MRNWWHKELFFNKIIYWFGSSTAAFINELINYAVITEKDMSHTNTRSEDPLVEWKTLLCAEEYNLNVTGRHSEALNSSNISGWT